MKRRTWSDSEPTLGGAGVRVTGLVLTASSIRLTFQISATTTMSLRAAQRRPDTSAPSDGSRTITITGAPPHEDDGSSAGPSGESSSAVGTLRLRGATKKSRQRVVWSDDVVDNEGCGRKSSKSEC
jgi:hypothetical protein